MENLTNNSKSINNESVTLLRTAKFTEFGQIISGYDSGTHKALRTRLRNGEKLTFTDGQEEAQILEYIKAGKGLKVSNGFLFCSNTKINGDFLKISITNERLEQLKAELQKGTQTAKATTKQ